MDKKINRFVKLPLIIICVVICISGLRWLISQEPWILDQVANEDRLAMTFNELFSIEGNNTLAAYLDTRTCDKTWKIVVNCSRC